MGIVCQEADRLESVMIALAGHLSRAMLERYSHVRMKAKRGVVEAMRTAWPRQVSNVVPTKSPTVAHGTHDSVVDTLFVVNKCWRSSVG